MNVSIFLSMTNKINKGFKTKKDIIISMIMEENKGSCMIESKGLGLFIITLTGESTKESFENIIKKGFGKYGVHGGSGDVIIDMWLETEIGKIDILGIPEKELVLQNRV